MAKLKSEQPPKFAHTASQVCELVLASFHTSRCGVVELVAVREAAIVAIPVDVFVEVAEGAIDVVVVRERVRVEDFVVVAEVVLNLVLVMERVLVVIDEKVTVPVFELDAVAVTAIVSVLVAETLDVDVAVDEEVLVAVWMFDNEAALDAVPVAVPVFVAEADAVAVEANCNALQSAGQTGTSTPQGQMRSTPLSSGPCARRLRP